MLHTKFFNETIILPQESADSAVGITHDTGQAYQFSQGDEPNWSDQFAVGWASKRGSYISAYFVGASR
jgi:hypothetical protein